MSLSSLSSLSDNDNIQSTRRNIPKLNALEKYNEDEFQQRFRLHKDTVMYLTGLIGDKLKPFTKRNRAIEAVDQILIALRFFATGSYQRVVGDLFNVQQSTVHRIIHTVTVEIAKLKNMFIYMPRADERQGVANEFYLIAGFPRVIGAIDCTHIKITSPGGFNAEHFRNRKGYFSLNVQMVCDPHLKIRNIIARWPGSVHDSTIFNDSPLCAEFERGDFSNYLLLGDSGYPCRSYLLTPFNNPTTSAENEYNRAQINTRNPVERLYGVLKRRFPCLQIGLRVNIKKVPAIIVACTVLHNIAISRNDIVTDSAVDVNEQLLISASGDESPEITDNTNYAIRNSIVQTYFS